MKTELHLNFNDGSNITFSNILSEQVLNFMKIMENGVDETCYISFTNESGEGMEFHLDDVISVITEARI